MWTVILVDEVDHVVAGDKAGQWQAWYRQNIPVADDRYDQWLADQQTEEG